MCTVRVNLYSKRHNSELIDGINRDLPKESLCNCHVTFWLITFYDIPMTSEMLHVLMVKKLLGDTRLIISPQHMLLCFVYSRCSEKSILLNRNGCC